MIRIDDPAAVCDLSAAVGRRRTLRRFKVNLRCGRFTDRELADDVLAPLVAATTVLTHLYVGIGLGGLLGSAAAGRLAALAPHLRSLELVGVTFDPDTCPVSATIAQIVDGARSLYRLSISGHHPPHPRTSATASAAVAVVPRWPVGLGVLRLKLVGYPLLAETGHLAALLDGLRRHASAGGRLTEFCLHMDGLDRSDVHRDDICGTVDALMSLREIEVVAGRIWFETKAPGITDRLRRRLSDQF